MNPDELISELRDIKPAIEIPVPHAAMSPYAIAAIVLLGLALVAAAIWWLRRRHRKPDPIRSALDELLATRELLENADSETYAIAISNVLRRYIEATFGCAAVRQTSEEFLAGLAGAEQGPIRAHRDALRYFLRHCDLVKFARDTLDTSQRRQLHTSAREFIEATSKPQHLGVVRMPAADTHAAA